MESRSRRAVELKPGGQIAARYRIERVLHEGSGGTLLASYNLENGALVALKVFPPSASEEKLISRFRRAQNVDTPFLPKLFELGVIDDGRPFIAMEYLAGAPLAQRLTRGVLSIEQAVAVFVPIVEAIAAAHRSGVVHRRLRTSRIFEAQVAGGGTEVRVLGLATGLPVADNNASDVPEDLDFLAPEQLDGVNHGERAADIWALGVVFFELLTGKRPFSGLTRKALAKAIAEEGPKRPRSLRPEIPWQVEQIVLRCLDKTAGSRFESAEELLAALEPFSKASPSGAPTDVSRRPASTAPLPLSRSTHPPLNTPAEALMVPKLGHLLGGEAPAGERESTPGFHRLRSDGQIEGMKVDDVVGIARSKRIAGEAARLKEEAQRRGASLPPAPRSERSIAPARSAAPPARSAGPPARSAAASPASGPTAPRKKGGVSVTQVVVLFIIVAVVLGLGVGLMVRALL